MSSDIRVAYASLLSPPQGTHSNKLRGSALTQLVYAYIATVYSYLSPYHRQEGSTKTRNKSIWQPPTHVYCTRSQLEGWSSARALPCVCSSLALVVPLFASRSPIASRIKFKNNQRPSFSRIWNKSLSCTDPSSFRSEGLFVHSNFSERIAGRWVLGHLGTGTGTGTVQWHPRSSHDFIIIDTT